MASEWFSEYPPWADLPEPIVAHITSYLSLVERCKIASVCKSWKSCIDTPVLWKVFSCGFFFQSDSYLLGLVKKYGHYTTHLTISLNQGGKVNRENALMALNSFAELEKIRLTHLKISFKGLNPLFFAGTEFVLALSNLLVKIGVSTKNSKLKSLNLSESSADFDDQFIECVSCYCPNLEYLNLLNKVLVCNITSFSMKLLVTRCQNLQVLRIYYTCLSDEVLEALSEPDRVPLKRLGLVCRRAEKYGQDLSKRAWSQLLNANPHLKVELGFDETCPFDRIAEIMKPEIPVDELYLETFAIIYPEIHIASSHYNNTLEKLVVQTRPSKNLNEALLNLAQRCHKLQCLLVYCLVDEYTKEQILKWCPVMERKGSYILKTEMEPEPWTVGKEVDCINCS